MSQPSRIYQLEHLTEGRQLPLPALHPRHVRVIVNTLRRIWDEIVKDPQLPAVPERETDLNGLMCDRLSNLIRSDERWEQLVRAATRGEESPNFSATNNEKRPDISLHLTRELGFYPLRLECKIINYPRDKGVDLYCKEGLRRFVEGTYSWDRQEGLMMAYVLDNSMLDSTLSRYLSTRVQEYSTLSLPAPAGNIQAHTSRHHRSFVYLQPPGSPPGPITIYHVWLDLPPSPTTAPQPP